MFPNCGRSNLENPSTKDLLQEYEEEGGHHHCHCLRLSVYSLGEEEELVALQKEEAGQST